MPVASGPSDWASACLGSIGVLVDVGSEAACVARESDVYCVSVWVTRTREA